MLTIAMAIAIAMTMVMTVPELGGRSESKDGRTKIEAVHLVQLVKHLVHYVFVVDRLDVLL